MNIQTHPPLAAEGEEGNQGHVQQGKKKRSGKAREEAKALAIAAAAATAAAAAHAEAGLGQEEDEQVQVQGVKRKRDDDGSESQEDEQEEEETSSKPDWQVIGKRIPQALKSLLPILKKAKAGETQRVIKKVKFLRKKAQGAAADSVDGENVELRDLEMQLEALKKLDLHALLAPLLLMKLRKHPFLRTVLPLPADLLAQLSSTPVTQSASSPSTSTTSTPTTTDVADLFASSTLEGKVRNRLLSSKGVGEQVNGVVGWCVGVEGGKLKAGVKRARPTPPDVVTKAAGKQQSVANASGSRKERKKVVVGDDDDLAAQNAAADAAGWESGSVDDFSGDDSDNGGDDDMDDSDVVREEDYGSSSPGPSSAAPGKKPPTQKNTGSGSLFLPTLASGFTMGDYDSDPDEDERRDKKSGKGGLIQSVRKNRRGQAERRKIWEKKYGKGANHVKKQEEEGVRVTNDAQMLASQMGGAAAKPKWGQKGPAKADGGMRDSGWTAKRPPTTTAAPYVASAPAKDPPKLATTATGTEHPSWAAARARKEKMEMVAAVKPKKIVFD